MQTTLAGVVCTVVVPLVSEDGVTLVPTQVRYCVMDEMETVLVQKGDWVVKSADTTSVTVVIDGALNILTPPATTGLRTVAVDVQTADGQVTIFVQVLIRASTVLAFGQNSFITYGEALMRAERFPDLQIAGWLSEPTRVGREKALQAAYMRVMLLPIQIVYDDTQSLLSVDTEFDALYGPLILRNLSPQQMLALYKPMLEGLKMAQFVEADEILNADPSVEARKSGLTAKIVGESSEYYRQSTSPLELPVSTRALAYLQRWVRFRARLARA